MNENKNKRILIFSTNYFPNIGGAEVAVKEITDRLGTPKPDEKEGEGGLRYTFDLIAPRFKRSLSAQERIGNVDVYRVGLGTRFDKFLIPFLGLQKAKKLHKTHAYDIAWSLMASQASVAAAWFKKKYSDVPLILTVQEGDEETHLKRYVFGNDTLHRWLIRPWHLKVFQYADCATVISSYLKDRTRQNGVPADRITIVPNGVDVERFQRESGSVNYELRRELGIQNDEKVVFTASRLVKKNGIGDLVSAMKYLSENIKLVIAGDGGEREALKARAYKFGNRVRFIGEVSHDELPAYLAAADVFARPSLSEGMGNAFIEAMAASVPVVATPVGGIPDFLEHEKTGLFCELGDPKSIAEQITRFIEDNALKERITANAYNMVDRYYSWEQIAEQMKEVFNTTTKNKG